MAEQATNHLKNQEKTKDNPNQSNTLNQFRETLKDVLDEITALEVNTIIVSKIVMSKFDAVVFYDDLLQRLTYQTEDGLQNVKRSLLDRSNQLKQKGAAISPSEMEKYNRDLEIYRRAERTFNERKNAIDSTDIAQFNREQECYADLANKVLKLNLERDDQGVIKTDAQLICYFRKLWEIEQMVLNGEQTYAQTRFQLDGDLTNRFIDGLFIPSKQKIDPKSAQLIVQIHHDALENAQGQWSKLIETCLNLVKNLIPYRIQK
ncbi:hypothetical protein HCU40_05400 [Pseudanabaena biceps]|nr:hypothetical protein [Pseudanabaena biceps]